ncbi:MAG: ankyrin repeat domain-containing protein [Candidatus Jidaibacter sp.]|jgi:hypothetical protein|nr:ankyrin repeat domain-containing protein [Candidatus Jidaibacter sp.]
MRAAVNFIYQKSDDEKNCKSLKEQLELYPEIFSRTIGLGNYMLNLAGVAIKADKPMFLEVILKKKPELLIVSSPVISPLEIAVDQDELGMVKIVLDNLKELYHSNLHIIIEDVANCLLVANNANKLGYEGDDLIKALSETYIDLCRENKQVKGKKLLNGLLIAACELSRTEIIESLLYKFPNLAIANDFGISPLKIATRTGNIETIRTVLSSPAFEKSDKCLISSELFDCIQLSYKQGLDECEKQEDYDRNNIVRKILGEAFIELSNENQNNPSQSRF